MDYSGSDSDAHIVPAPCHVLLLVDDSDDAGDVELAVLLVEEDEPDDVVRFVEEDETFDVPFLLEVALVRVDNGVVRHHLHQLLGRFFSPDSARGDGEDEGQGKQELAHDSLLDMNEDVVRVDDDETPQAQILHLVFEVLASGVPPRLAVNLDLGTVLLDERYVLCVAGGIGTVSRCPLGRRRG